MTVRCPECSTENEDGSRFCMECGVALSTRRIVSTNNVFSDEDTDAIDKLIFNISGADPHRKSIQEDDGRSIIALGDVCNVPEDYRGCIRTTGKITFSEGSVHRVEVRYRSSTRECRKEAIFRKAFIIKRVADCILIQTDFATYRMTDSMLGPVQRRVFSRTPIVVVRENDRYYLMCEKSNYLVGDDGPLDGGCIYQVVPLQEYGIGNFASFRFS